MKKHTILPAERCVTLIVQCSVLQQLIYILGWHILFVSLWKDFRARFSGIIESLKAQRDFVDREAMSLHIVEAKNSQATLQNEIQQRQKFSNEMLDVTEKNLKIAQLHHSVAWLGVDDKLQEIELEKHSHRRHPETCQWLISESKIKAWIENNTKSPLLWMNGKPGAGQADTIYSITLKPEANYSSLGKSVLCSYLVATLGAIPGVTVCYYFCNSSSCKLFPRRGSLSTVLTNMRTKHRRAVQGDLCHMHSTENALQDSLL
jgi:hypothetical protein